MGKVHPQDCETQADSVALRFDSVSKSFGAVQVVKDISLTIREGSVHALVGENGAGKSTLLGMLSGRLSPSAGKITAFGEPLPLGDALAIRRRGISTIYQELTIFEHRSALENVFVGQYLTMGGVLRHSAMRRRFNELSRAFGIKIAPHSRAGSLPVSQRQVLEILRGVNAEARVLVLDEPTSALAEHEREALHDLIRTLRSGGKTILLVSHNLEEVLDLSDEISVLRAGELVASAPRESWTRDTLIAAMVGDSAKVVVDRRMPNPASRELVLEVTDLVMPGRPPLSLTLGRGEILGLWGLVGSGRTSILSAIGGSDRRARGRMRVAGIERPWPRVPRAAHAAGIANLPEDRRRALLLRSNAIDNINLGRPNRGFVVRRSVEMQRARIAERLGFDLRRLRSSVGQLSGGNQQKVLLAKWVSRSPSILLVDEPTRGIDIAAKTAVLDSLADAASQGFSIIVTSSELEEVLSISDRLLVFAHGRIVAEVRSDSTEFNPDSIVQMGFVA